MALPFLPFQHIQSKFVRIESLVSPIGKMHKLINYICQPWIEQSVFVPHCWTVYNIKANSAIIDYGCFGMVQFTLSLDHDCFYDICAVVSAVHYFLLLLLKH